MTAAKVAVDNQVYDIHVGPGLLQQAAPLIASAAPAARYAIIADTRVAPLYAERLREQCASGGLDVCVVQCPEGEKYKTPETWLALHDALTERGLGRDGAVLALGGGVTGDLAGFVAATYRRGIAYVQLPTSLLAMVDASIGGKTGVDTAHGKNLVGTFHHPALVLADISTLATLEKRHFRAGLAEVIKHGVIADTDVLTQLCQDAKRVLDRNEGLLTAMVRRSVEIKAAVVTTDPREGGLRAVLNYGHTFGHAIESASGYELLHGEAVAVGMVLEAKLAEAIGACQGISGAVEEVLRSVGLPIRAVHIRTDAVMRHLAHDKKNRAGAVRFALPRQLGGMLRLGVSECTIAVDETTIKQFLDHEI